LNTEVCRAKSLNIVGVARFLAGKVVAGEAENLQATVAIVFKQRFKRAVLRREAAFGGDVNDQQNLAFELG
jgi:hypothetical protein